jgi:hypothetical protein
MNKKAPFVQLLLLPAQCLWIISCLAIAASAQFSSPSGSTAGNLRNMQDSVATNEQENTDMNIVMFYADDWTFRNIGKLNPLLKTPNIDEMADNGVLYKHNCVTSSICWMSRATMMTGQFASVHQQLAPESVGMYEHWNETLYPQLRAAGYDVGYVGKW